MTVMPATAPQWADLADLFGRGVVRPCGCMWFRQEPAQTKAGWSAGGNLDALRELVCAGRGPGLLGYDGEGGPP
jgi:hypothetical protein